MLKALWVLALLCLMESAHAQTFRKPKIVKNKFTDSIQAASLKEEMEYDLPIISVNEIERSENNVPFVPSLLSAGRDVFMSTASFHFGVVRFRMRGYDANLFSTQINGMPINNPDDGNTQWGLWSGLNDVTRNTQMVLGLRAGEQSFGNMGNAVSMDMRASKQREEEQFGYAFSNRSFTHRWTFTKAKGFTKKGWAYAVSGSFRTAAEGYFPGTNYSGGSYFIGIDKQLAEGHVLSFLLFGSAVVNGKQGPVLEESVMLADALYNPYWGFQSGKKRNANIGKSHQPVLIITDDHRINNNTSLVTTIGCVAGEKSSTGLDWYKASDPRPDYYRYLPSWQTDSVLKVSVADEIKNNEQLRQINWDHLFTLNRNSKETVIDANGVTGNSVTGLRSHYILEESVVGMKRLSISSLYNTRLNQVLSFSGGASLQLQETHYYKRVNDLLGGDYFVDWNQFAERDFPNDMGVIQNDLNKPNRIVKVGDTYGYDYSVNTNKAATWVQVTGSKKKMDFFAATEISYTSFYRNGKMKNGLFPYQSFGRSALNEFTHYAIKAGIIYKFNGRKYLYLHAAAFSKAPLFDDVFISPRTRDTKQENIQNEKIKSAEAGYVWNAPKIKLRISTYITGFTDGMNVTTFYHDGYGNFVNYALSGIDKLHFGTELGAEWRAMNHFSFTAAASVGRYYYNSRQKVSVSADNDAYVLEKALIYSQNFRLPGTPQEAYGLGIAYQSSGTFYLNLSGNYFRQQWLAFNPLRRTYAALENVGAGTGQWSQIIDQQLLPEQYTIDLSAGNSFRIKLFPAKHRQTLVFNISINNLLNKKDIISSGYEQLRFDTDTKNIDKFPPKYFYAMGFNFSANLSLRL